MAEAKDKQAASSMIEDDVMSEHSQALDGQEDLELICFEIISYVGTAKSNYVLSIDKAKLGDFAGAEELIKKGDEAYLAGHDVHMKLLAADAAGKRDGQMPLLLLHAEDQMASAEVCKLMALNFMETYQELFALRAQMSL